MTPLPNTKIPSISILKDTVCQSVERCRQLIKSPGIFSVIEMQSAGLHYTGQGDTARCNMCGIELTDWTKDLKPYDRHILESPNCELMRSLLPEHCIKIEESNDTVSLSPFVELKMSIEARKRSFSHWPSSKLIPSSAQMIQAGFFYCNLADRVICLYCNIICQGWISNTDNPLDVHRTLSPRCPFVLCYEKQCLHSPVPIVNITCDDYRIPETKKSTIAPPLASHKQYSEMTRREASFSTWPKENLPSVESLVRAGFYYNGVKTVVTCFYCGGSLQNWGRTDNPLIEHARWFPNCVYIKQLCDPDLFLRIQTAQAAQQSKSERSTNNTESSEPDDTILRRLVAARLDLDVSKRMLGFNFKFSIVRRCWEDQLKLKGEDFASETDLYIACTILDKQIKHINGQKENIIIPSIAMAQHQQVVSQVSDCPKEESSSNTSSSPATTTSTSKDSETPTNPCIICLCEEKQLACLPCGHLTACVPCGHSLKACAICRREITGFMRIYL